jgi:hypothetical protein
MRSWRRNICRPPGGTKPKRDEGQPPGIMKQRSSVRN